MLSCREEEDWGGINSAAKKTKEKSNKRKSRYLGRNQKTIDVFLMENVDSNRRQVPIMKSGNHLKLQVSIPILIRIYDKRTNKKVTHVSAGNEM